MAHELIKSMGIYKYLDVYHAREATKEELNIFHDP